MTMATFTGFILLFLFSVATAAFGCDRGHDYIAKVQDSPKDVAVRLARLDLISYLLTSVPLFGGLMILLNRDPTFIVHLPLPDTWNDVTTVALGLVASLGIGLGIARRRWALKVAANR
jgi:hypothetical protein